MTENNHIDKARGSKLAKTLEGLHFPVDKSKILSYVTQKKSPREAQYNNTLQILLQKNLTENKQYHNIYEIEKQAGLDTQQK
jgi:hypothetical protein